MSEHCLSMSELESVPRMDRNDPRRIHAERCPRCSALLAALRLFNDPSRPAPGARVEDAERRLAEFLDPRRLPALKGRRSAKRQWWLLGAVAAVLVISISLPRFAAQHTSSPVPLRGEASLPPAPVKGEAVWNEDGGLDLRWPAFSDSERVDVVFYALDLSEIARIPAPEGDHLHLDPTDLPPSLRRGEILLWSAVAVGRDGRQVHTARQMLQR